MSLDGLTFAGCSEASPTPLSPPPQLSNNSIPDDEDSPADSDPTRVRVKSCLVHRSSNSVGSRSPGLRTTRSTGSFSGLRLQHSLTHYDRTGCLSDPLPAAVFKQCCSVVTGFSSPPVPSSPRASFGPHRRLSHLESLDKRSTQSRSPPPSDCFGHLFSDEDEDEEDDAGDEDEDGSGPCIIPQTASLLHSRLTHSDEHDENDDDDDRDADANERPHHESDLTRQSSRSSILAADPSAAVIEADAESGYGASCSSSSVRLCRSSLKRDKRRSKRRLQRRGASIRTDSVNPSLSPTLTEPSWALSQPQLLFDPHEGFLSMGLDHTCPNSGIHRSSTNRAGTSRHKRNRVRILDESGPSVRTEQPMQSALDIIAPSKPFSSGSFHTCSEDYRLMGECPTRQPRPEPNITYPTSSVVSSVARGPIHPCAADQTSGSSAPQAQYYPPSLRDGFGSHAAIATELDESCSPVPDAPAPPGLAPGASMPPPADAVPSASILVSTTTQSAYSSALATCTSSLLFPNRFASSTLPFDACTNLAVSGYHANQSEFVAGGVCELSSGLHFLHSSGCPACDAYPPDSAPCFVTESGACANTPPPNSISDALSSSNSPPPLLPPSADRSSAFSPAFSRTVGTSPLGPDCRQSGTDRRPHPCLCVAYLHSGHRPHLCNQNAHICVKGHYEHLSRNDMCQSNHPSYHQYACPVHSNRLVSSGDTVLSELPSHTSHLPEPMDQIRYGGVHLRSNYRDSFIGLRCRSQAESPPPPAPISCHRVKSQSDPHSSVVRSHRSLDGARSQSAMEQRRYSAPVEPYYEVNLASPLDPLTGNASPRVSLVVDNVRFVIDAKRLQAYPDTMLGRMLSSQFAEASRLRWSRSSRSACPEDHPDGDHLTRASSSSTTATAAATTWDSESCRARVAPDVVLAPHSNISAQLFRAILDYYLVGYMSCPPGVSVQELKEACDYFLIPFNHHTVRCSNLRAFLHELSNDGAHAMFERFLEAHILSLLVKCARKGERECHVVVVTDDEIIDWDPDYPPQMPENELRSHIIYSTQMFRFLKYIENREVAKQVLLERGLKKIRIGIEGYPTSKDRVKFRPGVRPEAIYNYIQCPFLRMSWEEEENKSRHVDFQCVKSKSVSDLTTGLEQAVVDPLPPHLVRSPSNHQLRASPLHDSSNFAVQVDTLESSGINTSDAPPEPSPVEPADSTETPDMSTAALLPSETHESTALVGTELNTRDTSSDT